MRGGNGEMCVPRSHRISLHVFHHITWRFMDSSRFLKKPLGFRRDNDGETSFEALI